MEIAIMGVLALAAAALFAVAFGLFWLGDGNILVTKVPEGRAKFVMRGEEFSHLLLHREGYHVNDPNKPWYREDKPQWDMLSNTWDDFPRHRRGSKQELDRMYDDRFFLLRMVGLYWVGLYPFKSIYRYEFTWNEVRISESTGEEELVTRREWTDHVRVVDYTYAMRLKEAETRNNIPLDVDYATTAEMVNPVKAIFAVDDWMTRVSASTNRVTRNFIGRFEYDELVSETNQEEGSAKREEENFSKPQRHLTSKLPDDDPDAAEDQRGLYGHYGIVIKAADLMSISITEGPMREKFLEATTQKYTADQGAYEVEVMGKAKAAADLAEGTAAAKVITLKGEAQANALKARLEVLSTSGRLGELLIQVDAMAADQSGKTVIWAQNPFLEKFGLDSQTREMLDAAGISSPEDFKRLITSLKPKRRRS